MKNQFLNPDGYRLAPNTSETIRQGKQVYDYISDDLKPLAYFTGTTKVHPAYRFPTDLGSIPSFLQGMPGFSKDSWILSYLFHDSNCLQGGLWCGKVFIGMTREEADRLLYAMIAAEAALKGRKVQGAFCRPLIWLGVRIGAFFGIGVRDGEIVGKYSIRKAR